MKEGRKEEEGRENMIKKGKKGKWKKKREVNIRDKEGIEKRKKIRRGEHVTNKGMKEGRREEEGSE